MRRFVLFLSLFTPTLPAFALDTRQVAPERLLTLGSQLSSHAGNSQWQQLWQRTRAAGHFAAGPGRAYFTIDQAALPELARQALGQAEHVQALDTTQVRYKRAIPGSPVGMLDGQPLHSLCVVIDWRSLPEAADGTAHASLRGASLMATYPCN